MIFPRASVGLLGHVGRSLAPSLRRLVLFAGASAGSLFLWAAAPPAGTTIGNAASATYKDNANADRQVTSNVVTTVVQQVYSFDLQADRTAALAPGGQVFFSHKLTNTGNGNDSYTLTVANATGDTFDLNSIAIYADANLDGLPDNNTNLAGTSLPLTAGSSYGFVAVGSAPGSQTNGSALLTITATAAATQTPQTRTNTDTATITANAVISVTKAISRGSGLAPVSTAAANADPLTYTFTYTNTGNTAATDLIITDAIPTGMSYVATSARWSGTGSTVLTDANAADDQSGIVYDYAITTAGTARFKIAAINPGSSGTLSFQITITPNIVPQTINNTAQFSYDPDGAGATSPTSPAATNTVPYVVGQVASVAIGTTDPTQNGETAPTGGGLIGTVATASPGDFVTFIDRVMNTGNGTDSFDITITANTFPSGTAFILYKSDSNTPLVDNNGNGVPDTGPLDPGLTYNIVVKAVLPTSGAGSGPYSATIQATSKTDATKTNTTLDFLTSVNALSVDLTNNAPASDAGTQPGEGAYITSTAATITNTTNPGQLTTFTLYAYNPGSVPDSYNLASSANDTFSPIVALPTNWILVIKDPSTGNVITNTGVIAPLGNKAFTVEITPPADASSGTTDVYFRVLSPTTGAFDRIRDAVTVGAIRNLTLTPNNTGQTYPGGSVVYEHTLKNNGNVIEGALATLSAAGGSRIALTLADTLTAQGWNSVVYYDANNDGVLDPSDPVVTDLSFVSGGAAGLAPAESVRLFTKVFAPAGAASLASNTTTLTATTTNGTGTGAYTSTAATTVNSTDTTTIVLGALSIVKSQVLDVNCAGTGTSYSLARISTGAVPGSCVMYKIVVTNTGSAPSTSIKVYDVIPSYTVYSATPAAAVTGGSNNVVTITGSNIEFDIGTLAPTSSATCTFAVRINQ